MKIGIIGTGYVGLVAGACFAEEGNHVVCMDKNEDRIKTIQKGIVPIYEPGLKELIDRNSAKGRLRFTTDISAVVKDSTVIFIAVGTPEMPNGEADISAVLSVAEQIGEHLSGHKIIVTKSTVPVGTHQKVTDAIASSTTYPFDVVSNPEFMKEGAAIEDFTKPDRVILGLKSAHAGEVMKQLYAPFMRKSNRIIIMDHASAEMSKYAANALLATKISFMNEVANLCERYGANVESVRAGIGSDARIGNAFLFPGVGYGGSCFPKDVKAFVQMGKNVGYQTKICQAVEETNRQQRKNFATRVLKEMGKATTVAIWGLSFKGKTDDVRESPAIDCVRTFAEAGLTVHAYDPESMANAKNALNIDSVVYFEDGYKALIGADALVVFTDWPQFRTPDFPLMKNNLKNPLVFDGRNLYDPNEMKRHGFRYFSVGR